ncbi:hypothetical protein Y032_0018g3640 [Ancylostoma ceylanicum]|uniref:G-protein coupled receptors family 1 profile domain-containing protein n=1 Tax=Ancylostoma ceylanicum TaxID=53326 RepID=A0A016V5H8_9BILA|nr:hypothetical protein Y032_0018g3640 [Ancylostoma ceylanicum]
MFNCVPSLLLLHYEISYEIGIKQMATTAVFLCGQLGALSVVLNVFVITALIRNRRRVLTNVFYVIVLHCAVLDVARGLCLIVYGLPYFANTIYKINLSISTKVALFRQLISTAQLLRALWEELDETG